MGGIDENVDADQADLKLTAEVLLADRAPGQTGSSVLNQLPEIGSF